MDDKTKIKQLEEQLSQSQKLITQFKNLLDSIPDPIFMKDENLLWIYENPVILNLYNIDPNNYIGKAEDELLPQEFAQSCMQSDIDAKNSKILNKSEERARDKEGNLHYYEVFKVPSYNQNDTFEGLIGIGRDITKTKQLTEQLSSALEEQKKLNQTIKLAQMGEMIENIAHQWRQPLSVINSIASTHLLQHELGLLEDLKLVQDFTKIYEQVGYMNQTITDFRDFIKESKVKEQVNIFQTIEQSLNILKGHMKRYDIEIINNITKSNTCILGIKNELMQVIINIINNAKDAIVEKGNCPKVITLYLREDENTISIEIEDEAGGIPLDVMPHIFKPHFTTKKENGTGIGLYMSNQIMQQSFDGIIKAYNTNNGAKFVIEIPKSELYF